MRSFGQCVQVNQGVASARRLSRRYAAELTRGKITKRRAEATIDAFDYSLLKLRVPELLQEVIH